MTYMAKLQHNNPCPVGHKIYNFGRPFLEHYYYTLSSSESCLGVEKKNFEEIMHLHYMTNMATPQYNNPDENCNFGRLFLGHYYYILNLFDLCLGLEKKTLSELMHFHYMTYMATPYTRIPQPGVMKFTILEDPSIVIITIHLDCLIYALEQRRRFLKKLCIFAI